MSHLAAKSAYSRLQRRLDAYPQGAPASPSLTRILEVLFDEREADLVSRLPLRPFTVSRAARVWKMTPDRTRAMLDKLADRGLLVDIDRDGEPRYVLPPAMAGFFEFSLMRVGGNPDAETLSRLFRQYLNVEEDFLRELVGRGKTQLGRIFVHETALPPAEAVTVLDYERASEVIRQATCRAVGVCYCRHKNEHLGTACDAPRDICLALNSVAGSLSRHGVAREIDAAEATDLLQQARDRGLVQFGENCREGVGFICNCCGCCCEALVAARRFAFFSPVHTTNFIPVVDRDRCSGCGRCVNACPVDAAALVSAHDPREPRRKTLTIDGERCLGCGVCVAPCPTGAIGLVHREKRVITPVNGAHRIVVMAIERGLLQNLIFDNRILLSHRALGTLLEVILKLPPAKQILASEQVKSRFLARLLAAKPSARDSRREHRPEPLAGTPSAR